MKIMCGVTGSLVPIHTIERAYLYGHYDSRGGATLIQAHRKYLEIYGWQEVPDILCDDFMGKVEVIFMGLAIDYLNLEGGEDLIDGEDMLAFDVWQKRPGDDEFYPRDQLVFISRKNLGVLGDEEEDMVVGCVDKDEPNKQTQLRYFDLGEDAFGCVYYKV